MAREPSATDFAADYEALLTQMAAMREDMGKLAAQMAASATAHGASMAGSIASGVQDARQLASRKAHEADQQLVQTIAANPYLALGLAAGLGLLVGVVTRR